MRDAGLRMVVEMRMGMGIRVETKTEMEKEVKLVFVDIGPFLSVLEFD